MHPLILFKEAAGLDKSVSELSTDLEAVTDELAAVLKGLEKLEAMCVAKAEPYAESRLCLCFILART